MKTQKATDREWDEASPGWVKQEDSTAARMLYLYDRTKANQGKPSQAVLTPVLTI